MISLLLDRSDNNAPNQAMIFSQEVLKLKESLLDNDDNKEISITLDSPVPYKLSELILKLKEIDMEMVPERTTEKQGPYHGKLTRFIQRLDTKKNDKRLNFMFSENSNVLEYQYLNNLCTKLMNGGDKKGIKIIDFSEVPSDILPLIVSLLARIIFTVQQWSEKDARFPIALFCDEAHLYIPENTPQSIDEMSLHTFERIAKEGRKYGVGLVVISQRPSEVNKTVLSQSANYIIMKLTNTEDQAVVKKLLPDSLGDYTDILPTLDIGEALVVGDASLLPNRVYIKEPTLKPISSTIDFWSIWSKNDKHQEIDVAVESLRNQSRN